jgi:CBS domain-containing protein
MSTTMRYETGRALRAARVRDVMTTELVSCAAEVPLAEAAELMTRHRIHSLVVLMPSEEGDRLERRWGVLSDLDLVAAAPWDVEAMTAGSVAASPSVLVTPDETLAAAALAMAENATAHLLVAEEGGGEPVGILSALDVAGAVVISAPPARARRAPAVRPGDRLIIAPHHQGEPLRDAEVLEARGEDGGPPYLVRWQDSGRVSLHYPGSDAAVERLRD